VVESSLWLEKERTIISMKIDEVLKNILFSEKKKTQK
jgi:hypothetical protein